MSKDPYHKSKTISRWNTVYGLILRPNETYDEIYDKVMNATNCEICQVNLIDGKKSNSRCMDHDHTTGYFRMVLCHKCNNGHKRGLQHNNTTGIRNIVKFQNGWRYQSADKTFSKYSTNKNIVLWTKFIHQKIQNK